MSQKLKVLGVFSALFLMASCGLKPENSSTQEEIEDRHVTVESYKPLVGVYEGSITPIGDEENPIPIELSIFLVEEQNGVNENNETRFRPVLRARYMRLDLIQDGSQERNLVARYYKETGELTMQTSSNSEMLLSLSGKIDSNTGIYSGQAADRRGVLGTFVVKKNKSRDIALKDRAGSSIDR